MCGRIRLPQNSGITPCKEYDELLTSDWKPLDYQTLYKLGEPLLNSITSKNSHLSADRIKGLYKAQLGTRFEEAALESAELTSFGQFRPSFEAVVEGQIRRARPDATDGLLFLGFTKEFPYIGNCYNDVLFVDVKTTDKEIVQYYQDDDRKYQIPTYINYLGNTLAADNGAVPSIWFITPAKTTLEKKINTEAHNKEVGIYHSIVYYNAQNNYIIKVGRLCLKNGPIFNNAFPPYPYGIPGTGFNGHLWTTRISTGSSVIDLNQYP